MKSKNQKDDLRDTDLPDTEKDERSLDEQMVTLDLPDVEDIPGQEHIKQPHFGEFADTTIASDDEEGVGLFDDDLDESSNVTASEKRLLQQSSNNQADEDEQSVESAALDQTDVDGDPVNEGNLLTDRFGEDLDLPESEETTEEG